MSASKACSPRFVALALLLVATACTKSAPPVVVPNATHINGVPVEDYVPRRSDRRNDMVITVATPTAASAPVSAVSADVSEPPGTTASGSTPSVSAAAATAASAASTAATTTAATAQAATSGIMDVGAPMLAIFTPAVVAAAEMAPDGSVLSSLTFVDGERVRVTLVDRASGTPVQAQINAMPATGATVIHVSGLGAGGDINDGVLAYANVCEVNHDSAMRFAQQSGASARTSVGFALMTDTCPGLWKYARFNRV